MGHTDDVVAAYTAAWAETDDKARLALLEQSWSDTGVYCDPNARVTGREALADHIGSFHSRLPGYRIDLASGVDTHDGYVRFGWMMYDADGAPTMEGVDFGQLDDGGRLARIVGFFGRLPAAGA